MLLSVKEKEIIKRYLVVHSSFSLNDLCNELIKQGSSSQTYVSGKYKIFPYVGTFIKSLTSTSNLKIIHSEEDLFITVNQMEESLETEEVLEDSGQLGLFL